jgi:hypothetical protein
MTCLSVAVTHSENLLRSRRHCLQQPSPASLALPTFHISRHSPEMQGFGRRLAVDRSFLTGETWALFCLVEKILKTRRLIARIAAIRQKNPVPAQEPPDASRGMSSGSPRWKPGDRGRVDAASAVGSVRSLPLAACQGVVRKPSARAGWCLQETPGASRGISSGSPRWKPGDHADGQWSQPARGFETGAIRKQSKGHARRRSRGSIRAGGARSVAVSFACRRIP